MGEDWLRVYACYWEPGHSGDHGLRLWAARWTEEEAVQNRCPSVSPERYSDLYGFEPIHLRCGRKAGHKGMHRMATLGPYGRHDELDW